MSNIRLEQTKDELQSYNFFDIGTIKEVIKKPISEITDEKLAEYHMEMYNEPMNLYNVELTTSALYLREIPVLYRKNFIDPPAMGDQVLVAYLGLNKFPFIWQTITWDYRGARKTQRIPFPVDEDESYCSGNKANFWHLRKDGAVVIRGADVFREEGTSKTYIIIGGIQGVHPITDKKIVISIGMDQLGTIVVMDADGNTFFDAQKTMYMNSQDVMHMVNNILYTVVGTEQEKDETRKGEHNIFVGKKKQTYVGEELITAVGDVTKDDKRKQATAKISIAKKLTFNLGSGTTLTAEMIENDGKTELKLNTVGCEIKIDDSAKKISIDRGEKGKFYIDESGTKLGAESATQWMALGIKLIQWLATHKHISTSPGSPTSPTIDGGTLNNVLSKHHKLED